jgi:1,4-dihydroxy-2-naphthoate octaprenyltransferase
MVSFKKPSFCHYTLRARIAGPCIFFDILGKNLSYEGSGDLLRLLRLFPVILWSGGAFLIGATMGFADTGSLSIGALMAALSCAVLLQGISAHAFNDVVDWSSGTDASSPGVLSGGTKVIPLKIFTPIALKRIGTGSAAFALVFALILAGRERPGIWICFAIGVWAALFYTLPPFKLAYRPFLGEWTAAWPGVTAVGAGSYYLAAGQLSTLAFLASGIHGLLALGWLMQHHLSDIEADLSAKPVKLTTPAYVHRMLGQRWAPAVPAFYYLLAMFASARSAAYSYIFFFPLAAALICASVSVKTNTGDINDITSREITTGVIIIINSVLMAFFYLVGSRA